MEHIRLCLHISAKSFSMCVGNTAFLAATASYPVWVSSLLNFSMNRFNVIRSIWNSLATALTALPEITSCAARFIMSRGVLPLVVFRICSRIPDKYSVAVESKLLLSDCKI